MTKTADKKVVEFISQTPSGIEVLYQTEPKRLYKVRRNPGEPSASDPDPIFNEWVEVPSVTTILEVLDKPALPWWGMTVGVEGVTQLFNMGMLHKANTPTGQQVLCVNGPEGLVVAGKDEIVALLSKHALTVNHVKRSAGDRGQSVHDALELWTQTGELPDPMMFPPHEQGYVGGLVAFLKHANPHPLASEVTVGSIEHGYAGRYDLRVEIKEECQVVFHRTPVRGPQWATLSPGVLLTDLKTSKDVYPKTHFRQLEAYEQASIECGYGATDARGVIKVYPDGTYKFVRSTATFEDFRVVLDVWRSDQGLK